MNIWANTQNRVCVAQEEPVSDHCVNLFHSWETSSHSTSAQTTQLMLTMRSVHSRVGVCVINYEQYTASSLCIAKCPALGYISSNNCCMVSAAMFQMPLFVSTWHWDKQLIRTNWMCHESAATANFQAVRERQRRLSVTWTGWALQTAGLLCAALNVIHNSATFHSITLRDRHKEFFQSR